MDVLIYVLIYGTVNGVILALMAVGFTLVYGVSRVANFAHGALYVVTGFIAWSFFNSLGLPYGLAVILSLIIVTLFGVIIYQFCLIRVRGMPVSEIIVSFAIGLLILEGLRLRGIGGFRGFIGPAYILPIFVDGTVKIAGAIVDIHRLLIIAVGVAVVAVIWLFTHYTKMGLSLRAIAQDERAALMLGIDSDRTANIALAIGSALAGLAAIAILPLGNITAEAGYEVLTYAIAVCIIGGLGSWTGSIVAAFVLGFATTLTSAFGAIMFQKVVLFGAIILVLIFKPSGLFGRQKELEERV